MKWKALFFSLLLISLGGCAPWALVDGKYVGSADEFEVELPAGWHRATRSPFLLITRDGVALQQIQIERRGIDQDLEHTKKKVTKGMLPQEVAEVELDNIRSNPEVLGFELLENTPVTISGQPGFKLMYVFRTKEGLRVKVVHYGCLIGKSLYRVQYGAAARYYFDKDLATFERVMESFKLLAKAK